MNKLKALLDVYLAEFDYDARLRHDPLEIPHRFPRAEDAEVAAFVAAMFAYGRVSLFKAVVERILEPMGSSPASFLENFDIAHYGKSFRGLSYRFSTPDDLVVFLEIIGRVLRRHGSLQSAFRSHDDPSQSDVEIGLAGFMEEMRQIAAEVGRGSKPSPGLLHLLPSPGSGGAAKRPCLFLRWVVRSRDVDLGIWSGVSASRLVIPLDTHVGRISRCLGLTARKSSGWKTARDITGNLRKLDPEDPLRYDFPLCHLGMGGTCPGKAQAQNCKSCVFFRLRGRGGKNPGGRAISPQGILS